MEEELTHRVVPLRIDSNMHRRLKKASYLTEIPMSEIMREGIEMKLEEMKKVLTNADISV